MDDVIKVYGASWCPDCRRAKRFLGDQRISFEWHDIEVDPDGVRTVQERNDGNNIIPTIVFPDGSHLSEPSNEELAEKIGLERMATMHVYDLIIVGGGPAGLTTSIYAARENLQTLVIDSKGLGGPGRRDRTSRQLPRVPRRHRRRRARRPDRAPGAALRRRDAPGRLGALDLERRGGGRRRDRDRRPLPRAGRLIATGSTYRRTGAPGEDDLIGAGIHFCATCDGPFYKGASQLVVLGGGNSGLEEGLFLTQFVDRVTIVQRGDRLTANKLLQDKVMMTPEMEVLLNREVVEFRPKDDGSGKLGAVVLKDRETGDTEELHPAGAFVFIGLDPNTGFVKGSVDLDDRGLIVTDMGLQTSMPGVFAAGDVRSGSTKQLASAVGEGAAAAIGIRMYLEALDAKPMHVM